MVTMLSMKTFAIKIKSYHFGYLDDFVVLVDFVNLLTTTGHRCLKLKETEPPAVMSRDIGAAKTNAFCREDLFLPNEVEIKV